MCVDRRCFERQNESEQSAQSGRAGGTISRDPNRVRHNYGVSLQIRCGFRDDLLKIRRPDFFLKLPKKTNIHGHVRLDRSTRAKECAERGALVVSSAAAVVGVALFREHKRLSVPRLGFLRGGLHVDMVVNRYSRPVVIVAKDTMNYGISLFSAVNLDFAAVTFKCLGRALDP